MVWAHLKVAPKAGATSTHGNVWLHYIGMCFAPISFRLTRASSVVKKLALPCLRCSNCEDVGYGDLVGVSALEFSSDR